MVKSRLAVIIFGLTKHIIKKLLLNIFTDNTVLNSPRSQFFLLYRLKKKKAPKVSMMYLRS